MIIDLSSPPYLKGYKPVLPLHRGYSQCARLIVLVKDTVYNQVTIREDLMSRDVPSVWLDISTGKQTTTVCFTYREWSPKGVKTSEATHAALATLVNQIEIACTGRRPVLLMGDLNLCQDRWDLPTYPHRALADHLRDGLASCGLDILPVGHTYISNHRNPEGGFTRSALDHIYTNTPSCLQDWGKVDCGLSDHVPIQATLRALLTSSNTATITRRNFRNFDQNTFNGILASMPWEDLASTDDVDIQVEMFENFITCALNTCAPMEKVKAFAHHKNGITSETRALFKLRNRARSKAMKCKNKKECTTYQQEYKRLRNAAVAATRKDVCNHLEQKFKGLSSSTEVWRAANSILKPTNSNKIQLEIESELVTEENVVADYFGDFFAEKISKLKESIPANKKLDPMVHLRQRRKPTVSFYLKTVSENSVTAAVRSLKSKCSVGLDGLSTKILKGAIGVLAVPLTLIVNTSIISCQYPSSWKRAKVIPIHKKGNSHLASNYRPVSLLSAASKILESIVLWQVSEFCRKENIIPDFQFGFRGGRSTTGALACMYQSWLDQCEEGHYIGSLFFDLSAAFDCLDSRILISKLEAYGFSAQAQDWMNSYFLTRAQTVCIGESKSKEKAITMGVPQGSILGPMLFIIYVSDISLWTQHSTIYGYADDTTASVTASSMEDLRERLEIDANNILTFMASNGLCANPAKTGLLVMRPPGRQSLPGPLKIRVSGEQITESESHKLLGITVSNDLLWQHHIKNIEDQIRAGICMIKRLKSQIPRADLRGVLNGLVGSHLRYGIELFGDVNVDQQPKELKRLQVLLNRAARVTIGAKLKDKIRTEDLMDRAGIKSVQQMTLQSIITIVWKTLKHEETGLHHFWSACNRSTGSKTRSQARGDLQLPTGPLSRRKLLSLQVKGAKVWNSCSNEIRSLSHDHVPKKIISDFVRVT